MKAADLAVVKTLPGNDKCAECGQKQPQWASVSFGTVFCLECSGVHRSLGVHISFVRSIAMDSWTPTQLAVMKAGGNAKCASYLSSKGINSSLPIQQKYNSGPAKLYKLVLKARAEGKPEPTSLPAEKPRKPYTPSQPSASSQPYTPNQHSNGNNANKVEDQSGMERLSNESEADYVKRQLRLRDAAKARMAAKFGNNQNRTMGGVGSAPAPSAFGDSFSIEDVTGTLATGMSSAASGLNSVWNQAKSSGVRESVTATGFGLWSSISQSAQGMVEELAKTDIGNDDDGGDAFGALNQKLKSVKDASSRKYSGFGSDDMQFKNSMINVPSHNSEPSNNTPAPTTTNEDQNSIAPLTGETDKQYMERQIRIREEATKRLETKFGKSLKLGSASSSIKVDLTKIKANTNDDFFSSFGA